MGAAGLELMNFINPDLTWKTVAKGYRSSSRRTRKHGLVNFSVGKELLRRGPRMAEDGTTSDIEKHGVAILGRRFSDKIEDIPLKKRRLALPASSSPPSRSCHDESVFKCNVKGRFVAGDDSNRVDVQQNSTKIMRNVYDSSEDFSGMDILATVACSNSVISGVDDDKAKSSVQNDSSLKNMACEESKETSLLNETDGVAPKSAITKEHGAGDSSGSMRDDRLYWDLNVPEDAWERPSDCFMIDGLAKASFSTPTGMEEILEVMQNSNINSELKKVQESVFRTVLEDSKEAFSASTDSIEALGTREVRKEPNGFVISADLDKNNRVSFSAANELPGHVVADVNGPICSLDQSNDGGGSSSCLNIKEGTEAFSSDITLATGLNTQYSQAGVSNVTSKVLLDLEKTTDENGACFIESATKESCNVMQAKEALAVIRAEVNSPPHGSPEDAMQKSSGDSTVTLKEVSGLEDNGPSDDWCGSGVYQAEKAGMVASEVQAGYDSQFEDGELREPGSQYYYWDENEGEDGEVEQVDYGSECDEEKDMEAERGSTPRSGDVVARPIGSSSKMDIARDDDSVSPKSRVSDVAPVEKGDGPRDSMIRNNYHPGRRSENFRSFFPLEEKEGGNSVRYFGRARGGGMHMRGGRSPTRSSGNPSTSYWNSQRRFSPNRTAYLPGRPRARGFGEGRRYMMTSDRMDSESGFQNCVARQFSNSSPDGYGNRLVRRRSPPGNNRKDSYISTNRRMLSMRQMSPTRDQFRRFAQREDLRRTLPEDPGDYPNNFGHPRFSKRERSMSPLQRGRPNYPMGGGFRRSPSRSRMRSPPNYPLRRERNNTTECSLIRSRSPDPSGINRSRLLPFQKRFEDDRFISPTRRRFSSPRFDDSRNGGGGFDGFRGRKSPPVRMFRQGNNNRLNSYWSMQRNDNEFRRQPRNFRNEADFADSEEDDRNKSSRHGLPFEMSRGRLCINEQGSPMRRFRFNSADRSSLDANGGTDFEDGNNEVTDTGLARNVAVEDGVGVAVSVVEE